MLSTATSFYQIRMFTTFNLVVIIIFDIFIIHHI